MQRGDPRSGEAEVVELVAAQAGQLGHAGDAAPPLELVEGGQLGGVERDDHLAAALVGDPPVLAVGVEIPRALNAQPRLERTGRVVDAGVDHAAVAGGLVPPRLCLALEHDHSRAGAAQQHLARHRQPHDAGANDRDVAFGRSAHATPAASSTSPAGRSASPSTPSRRSPARSWTLAASCSALIGRSGEPSAAVTRATSSPPALSTASCSPSVGSAETVTRASSTSARSAKSSTPGAPRSSANATR